MYRSLPSAQQNNLPVATVASEKVLCLPIYPNLTNNEVNLICNYIKI